MKTKVLLSFCSLLTIASFSQDSSFQLKNYKYRTNGYVSLVFSTSLGGGFTNRKTNSDTSKHKNLGLSPTWIGYQKMKSTDKKQLLSELSISPVYSFSSDEQNSKTKKYSSGYTYLNWKFDTRAFKRNNWFWQIGNELVGETQGEKQSELSYTDRNDNMKLNDKLVLGFGKGRIEMVQDAQMALFILNDLKLQGLIDHQLSTEATNNFSKLITEVNNRRIFDFRRKRIYELTQIENYLRKNGIIDSTDIRHFTIINDNWTLAYNPLRSSGSHWFFHIVPSAQNEYRLTIDQTPVSKDELKTTITSLGIGPEVGYENYNPINLKWQRNIRLAVNYSNYKNITTFKNTVGGTMTKTTGSSYNYVTNFYFSYGIDYYPDNRTRVNSSFDITASITEGMSALKPNLAFSTDYFISYRTRLYACLSSKYEYQHMKYTNAPSQTVHDLNVSFGAGFSYAIL